MPKPNYSYEKRQRELQKKNKKEDKAMRKAAGDAPAPGRAADQPDNTDAPATPSGETPAA